MQPRRLGLRGEAAQRHRFLDAVLAVDTERAVVIIGARAVAGAGAVHEDRAEPRAPAEVLADPRGREVVRRRVADALGLHVQEADVGPLRLAGEARARLNRDEGARAVDADPAAEEQVDLARTADRKQPAILEEERALLREQQVESRQVDLLLVHLHLGEVGVVGEVERHARGDADLAVDAEIAGAVVPGLVLVREVAVGRPDNVGDELEVAGRWHAQPGQLTSRRQARDAVNTRHRRPVDDLALVFDVA